MLMQQHPAILVQQQLHRNGKERRSGFICNQLIRRHVNPFLNAPAARVTASIWTSASGHLLLKRPLLSLAPEPSLTWTSGSWQLEPKTAGLVETLTLNPASNSSPEQIYK